MKRARWMTHGMRMPSPEECELRFGVAKAKPEGARVAYDVRVAKKIRGRR